ncbi:YD repeat-containing protein [Duganella sp. CF458]|uniref:IPT/TIG domain-containing protein n=1 Tax=Duganella sp. CF458 TaxID=1884368 RepID=UPI0008F2580D|nr:IPT/TIG domain-containing protein [Duganella sp. CF458]SFG43735.1 YD repeat-containing protein [Duganella sp. CF458]
MLLGLAGRQILERDVGRSVLAVAWRLLVTLLIAMAVQANTPALADQIRYVYDEAGRLVQATSSDGSGTAYRYDEIGNILSVKRIVAGGVVISEFSPNSGAGGIQVSIYGSGFSEVATNNAVTFNGVSAVVLSATKTMLTVAVPANASTGKISVSNANGTATSSSEFVIATAKTPTITSFSPAMGPAATAITVTGTNFGAQPAANKVKIGEYAAITSSASPTQIVTSVPTIAASGKISVTTAMGKAVSANDFYALPPGVSAADIVHTGRLVAGGAAQTVQIGTAGKKAILLFEGNVKQMLSLLSSAGTFSSSPAMAVYSPDGRTVATTNINNNYFFDFPALPVYGTYTMVLSASAGGKVDLQLKAADTGALLVDGPAKAVNLSAAQNGYYTFNGEAGQYLGLGYTNLAMNPVASMAYKVFKPDGSHLFGDTWSNDNSNNLPMLPVTGIYTLLVDPPTVSSASLNVWLSKDIPGQLVFGQTTSMVSSRVGQNFRPTFNGVAGERYWLAFNGSTITSANVNVVKPDGTVLTSFSIGTSAANFEIPALPTTGMYAIFIDPTSTVTGKVDVQINQVAPDITGPIEINGAALPLALDVRQRALLTFNGTAGQHLGLGYANVTTNPASQSMYYTVLKPDGSELFRDNWSNSNSNNLPTLPVSGTYTIVVQSGTFATSSLSLLLSADVAGTLVPGAAPLNVNISRIGQNARLTFDAVAGQHYWLKMRNGTFPATATVYIYKPDGSTLNTTSISTSQDFDMGVLPVSGTYVVWIDPNSTNAGKVDVELVTIPADFVSPIEINGAALPISLAVRQRAMITFNGIAGQRLGLGYANVTTNPASQSMYYTVLKPDGSQLFWDNWGSSNSNNLPILPVSGTYTIVVQSGTFATSSLSLLLSADVSATLVPDAAPLSVNIPRIGQNAYVTFDGVAGKRYWLKLRGGTFASTVSVSMYKPDGSTLNTTSISTSQDFDTGPLPASGTYSIWFNPESTNTGKVDAAIVTIADDSVGAIAINGAGASVSLVPGQRAALSFTGVAGQTLGLGYTGASTDPASNSIYYFVINPDGTQLFYDNWGGNNSNDVPALPSNGTYKVVVKAANFVSVASTVWLSADVPGLLVKNDPAMTVSITRVGQNARLTFNGVAGQAYTLRFTDGAFSSSASVIVFNPNGSSLTSTSVASNATLNLPALATSGTYTVFIGPSGTTTGQVNVQLQ